MMPQGLHEVEIVFSVLAQRRVDVVGDICVGEQAQLVRRNPVPAFRQLFAEIGDDVPGHAGVASGHHGAEIVFARELDRLPAPRERYVDWRMRLLERSRPDGNVLVFPELAFVRENLLGPRLADDLQRLVEAGARFRHGHVVDPVFARHAAGEARKDAPLRHAVNHRDFLGDPQRIVQRQQVAEHQEFELLHLPAGRRRHHVGRHLQAVRRGVVLVEADAVVAERVHFRPDVQMCGVAPRRDFRIEIFARQRIGDETVLFEFIEMLPVGEQVHQIDFHGTSGAWPARRRHDRTGGGAGTIAGRTGA